MHTYHTRDPVARLRRPAAERVPHSTHQTPPFPFPKTPSSRCLRFRLARCCHAVSSVPGAGTLSAGNLDRVEQRSTAGRDSGLPQLLRPLSAWGTSCRVCWRTRLLPNHLGFLSYHLPNWSGEREVGLSFRACLATAGQALRLVTAQVLFFHAVLATFAIFFSNYLPTHASLQLTQVHCSKKTQDNSICGSVPYSNRANYAFLPFSVRSVPDPSGI